MTIENLKIPEYMFPIYKQLYEIYFKEKLDEDALIMPYDMNPYNIEKSNFTICYG